MPALPGQGERHAGAAALDIYPENVPAGAPLLDEKGYLDSFPLRCRPRRQLCGRAQTLTAHKSEYIYYRTDHHWTSLGAYYAYRQLCETLGLTPFDPGCPHGADC